MSEDYWSQQRADDWTHQLLIEYRRKRDQAWELAGCARQDGDTADELRWTQEAREYARKIAELLK